MDFFERQRTARADTRRLLVLFAIAVVAIVAIQAVGTAIVGIFNDIVSAITTI